MAARARVPNRSARVASAPKYPHTAERNLEVAFRKLAKSFAGYIRRNILPRVAEFAGKDEEPERTDAKDAKKNPAAKAEGRKMQAAADQAFSPKTLAKLSDKAAGQIAANSKSELKRLRINVDKEPAMKPLVSGWNRDIAQSFADMTAAQVATLEDILATGNGRHAKTIANEIEERLGIVANRAAFIARQSVAKLNSKITRARYIAADVEKYCWTTQGDDRVREAHEELDGEIFDCDGEGDPDEGHPGDAFGCRCTAWPMPPKDSQDEE